MTTLSVISYIERINRVYRLIRMERTGSLASLLRVSRRTINNYLEELRLMGAEIRFSRRRNTYYFGNNFVLHATVEARIDADVLDKPHEKEDDIYNYNKH